MGLGSAYGDWNRVVVRGVPFRGACWKKFLQQYFLGPFLVTIVGQLVKSPPPDRCLGTSVVLVADLMMFMVIYARNE